MSGPSQSHEKEGRAVRVCSRVRTAAPCVSEESGITSCSLSPICIAAESGIKFIQKLIKDVELLSEGHWHRSTSRDDIETLFSFSPDA